FIQGHWDKKNQTKTKLKTKQNPHPQNHSCLLRTFDNPGIHFNPLFKLSGFSLLHLKLFFQITLLWVFVLASKMIPCIYELNSTQPKSSLSHLSNCTLVKYSLLLIWVCASKEAITAFFWHNWMKISFDIENTNHNILCLVDQGKVCQSLQVSFAGVQYAFPLMPGRCTEVHQQTQNNVSCFSGLGHLSLILQFTVASYKIQLFLCNFQPCETLEGFWQVPSIQERSLFSDSQMQLKLAWRRSSRTDGSLKITGIHYCIRKLLSNSDSRFYNVLYHYHPLLHLVYEICIVKTGFASKMCKNNTLSRLKAETLEDDLDKYATSAMKMKKEKVDLKEFSAYLEFPESDTLESMFGLFDENEDGIIDIREFVIALSVVCKPSKTLETIQLAFQLYQSENGTITEEDLAHILKTAMGVSQINVTHLFRAVDEEEKGKITYDDFYRFAELHPHFAEDYLYADQMGAESSLETSPLSAPNGICTDFSPENADYKKKSLQKKLN
ncbi:PCAT1 acyltransferase, partial [Semnornis frantzii]|nr:PCAT1 acyltransferase [Semnornis frantzii]